MNSTRTPWLNAQRNQPKKHAQAIRQGDPSGRASAERALWALSVLKRHGWA